MFGSSVGIRLRADAVVTLRNTSASPGGFGTWPPSPLSTRILKTSSWSMRTLSGTEYQQRRPRKAFWPCAMRSAYCSKVDDIRGRLRSEEHTSELQSLAYLVCRLLLEKK